MKINYTVYGKDNGNDKGRICTIQFGFDLINNNELQRHNTTY